jgi:H+/gluconate symporter-like permease
MIDFTKIQTVPVPPPISALQKTNANLTSENKGLKIGIYIIAGAITAYLIYKFYKTQQEDEAHKKNQSRRD